MIVLDTNVVSEFMRRRPDGVVLGWWSRQDRPAARLTAVSVAELGYGVARLPAGVRRRTLEATIRDVTGSLEAKPLSFDLEAARRYGPLVAARERAGRPIGLFDAQIAAICLAVGATLATRNTRDFEGLGLEVVDPWTSPG